MQEQIRSQSNPNKKGWGGNGKTPAHLFVSKNSPENLAWFLATTTTDDMVLHWGIESHTQGKKKRFREKQMVYCYPITFKWRLGKNIGGEPTYTYSGTGNVKCWDFLREASCQIGRKKKNPLGSQVDWSIDNKKPKRKKQRTKRGEIVGGLPLSRHRYVYRRTFVLQWKTKRKTLGSKGDGGRTDPW